MFKDIQELIPQRPPFLFVDKVKAFSNKKISTSYLVRGDEDFFKGHFPGNPIMPGVLLQEALFQSGAALMALEMQNQSLGVITKVQNAKFKSMVKPLDVLEMEVELLESLSNAHYMKGVTRVNGKIALSIEFTVAGI